jgi:hypothetical protein
MPDRKYRTTAAAKSAQAQGQKLLAYMDRCFQVKLCLSEEQPQPIPQPPVCSIRVYDRDQLDSFVKDKSGLDASSAMQPFSAGLALLEELCTLALDCDELAVERRRQRSLNPCGPIVSRSGSSADDIPDCTRVPDIIGQICNLQKNMLSEAARFVYVSNNIISLIDYCCYPGADGSHGSELVMAKNEQDRGESSPAQAE